MSNPIVRSGAVSQRKLEKEDIKRTLGSVLASNQLTNRILALTKPVDYMKKITDGVKSAEDSAVATYDAIYKQYYDSGLTEEQSSFLAMQSARAVFDTQMNVISTNYPEINNSIYSLSLKSSSSGADVTPFNLMNPSDVVDTPSSKYQRRKK